MGFGALTKIIICEYFKIRCFFIYFVEHSSKDESNILPPEFLFYLWRHMSTNFNLSVTAAV